MTIITRIATKLGLAMITAIGMQSGAWLWREVLEDEARKLKSKVSKKKEP